MTSLSLLMMPLLTTFRISTLELNRSACACSLHFMMSASHGPRSSKRLETGSIFQSKSMSVDLSTPASMLSLGFATTPATSATDTHAEALKTLDMRSPSMPNLFASSSPSDPPDDLHTNIHGEPPPRSKTDTMSTIVSTFRASKTLHRVLGVSDPEPFVTPPAIPGDLQERFEAGLQAYEQVTAGTVVTPKRTDKLVSSLPTQQGKSNLAAILEEQESPVRSRATTPVAAGTSENLRIAVPMRISDKQAVAVTDRHTFLDSDSDAAKSTRGERADSESDDEECTTWLDGSRTTLAVSDDSSPSSAAGSKEALAETLFLPSISSLFPSDHYHSSHESGPNTRQPTAEKLPAGSRSTLAQSSRMSKEQNTNGKPGSYAQYKLPTLRRTESVPVLFPSPGVHKKDQDFRQPAQRRAGGILDPHNAIDETDLDINEEGLSSPTPRITIQAPSPVKAPASRKRAPPPSTHNDVQPPLPQRVRSENTKGLPILSSDDEAAWKADFPGNTYALLTILITWSHTMWTFFNRLSDPKLLSMHPAFPYSVSPPIRKQLVSVSIYDISTEPHKEIRFLGPGDAAEMSYHEVDVFNDPDSNTHPPPPNTCRIDAIKQSLGFAPTEMPKHTRYTSMSQRATTGEGRWCYVVIKAHSGAGGEAGPPPHILLAWPSTAVTSASDCLHTVSPHPTPSAPAAPAAPAHERGLKRFSSLQNLALPFRSSPRQQFHSSLRAASSSSELPKLDAEMDIKPQEGAVTLLRSVMMMKKAGGVPLVEGWRVDVRAFAGWMEACGRGEGKVILWRERDVV